MERYGSASAAFHHQLRDSQGSFTSAQRRRMFLNQLLVNCSRFLSFAGLFESVGAHEQRVIRDRGLFRDQFGVE